MKREEIHDDPYDWRRLWVEVVLSRCDNIYPKYAAFFRESFKLLFPASNGTQESEGTFTDDSRVKAMGLDQVAVCFVYTEHSDNAPTDKEQEKVNQMIENLVPKDAYAQKKGSDEDMNN